MQTKYSDNEAGTFPIDQCGLVYALEIIQGKWILPIIWALYCDSPLRYGQIKEQLGAVTDASLTRVLRDMESHNLIDRVEFDEMPPRVEYALTDATKELVPILQALFDWGVEQQRILGGCEEWEQAKRAEAHSLD